MPIGIEIEKLLIGVGLDTKGLDDAHKDLSRKMKGVGDKMASVGATLSKTITLPLVTLGGAVIKLASDAEEMQAKFDTVFPAVGAQVTEHLGTFASEVGRSRFELMGMASTLGDVLKPMGFTEERSGDLAVTLSKLATDLSSFNNMPMDEALDRLRGTLVGAHENALAFGVVINENTLKAELARNGWDKLTGTQFEQAKVQARINLLLAGTTDAQGDAARTAEGFANQLRALWANAKDVGIEFGKVLLPVATKVVKGLKNLTTWVSELSPEKKKLAVAIAAVAAALPPLALGIGTIMAVLNPWAVAIAAVTAAVGFLIFKWEDIKTWIDTKIPGFANVIDKVFAAIKDTVVWLGGVFSSSFNMIIGVFKGWVKIISGVWDIFAGVFTGDWSRIWDGVKSIFSGIWTGVKAIFANALNAILSIMPGFVKDWLGITDDVAGGAEKIEEKLGTAVPASAEKAGGAVAGVSEKVDALGGSLSDTTPKVDDLAEAAEAAAGKDASHGLKMLGSELTFIGEQLVANGSAVTDLKPKFQQFEDSVGPNIDAISDKIKTLPATMTDEVAPALTDTSPWDTFRSVAWSRIGSVTDALNSGDAKSITGALDTIATDLGIGGKLSGAITGTLGAIGGSGGMIGLVTNLAGTAVPQLGIAFGAISGVLEALGIDVDKILGGIIDGIGGVVNGISNVLGLTGNTAPARDHLERLIEGATLQGNSAQAIIDELMSNPALFQAAGLNNSQMRRLVQEIVERLRPSSGLAIGPGINLGTTGTGPVEPLGFDEFGNPLTAADVASMNADVTGPSKIMTTGENDVKQEVNIYLDGKVIGQAAFENLPRQAEIHGAGII